MTYLVVDMVSLASVVLVDQVQGVPSEVDSFLVDLGFTISRESFIGKLSNINIYSLVETFFLHPLSKKT
jgi:hypothetical protein